MPNPSQNTCNSQSIVDDLAMLNALIDNEDVILKIMNGLDGDNNTQCEFIRVRDNPFCFEELHENRINHEAFLNMMPPKFK